MSNKIGGFSKLGSISQTVAGFYDCLNGEKSRHRLEYLFVRLAVAGFLLHLALILFNRTAPDLAARLIPGIGFNFLQAVYTPFSFILFYEVLLLVLALPRSFTTSICKQYEIISLIVVRRVFKDIGSFEDFDSWLTQTDAVRVVLFDMGGALLMFLAVTLIYRIRKTVSKTVSKTTGPAKLAGFIQLKKMIAILLGSVLILFAAGNVVFWLASVFPAAVNFSVGAKDMDKFFFPAFFEFMIFTDVFLLIVSISYYDRYEYLFRNSGFVISTVLLRISLSSPKPYDLAISLISIFYGLGLISIFAFYTKVSASPEKPSV
ncbi:MAG: hypothetical protein ACI87E_002255 [Mariniblastus sp.]|jgi:hypothetical protein